jgi:hypothetical protein
VGARHRGPAPRRGPPAAAARCRAAAGPLITEAVILPAAVLKKFCCAEIVDVPLALVTTIVQSGP